MTKGALSRDVNRAKASAATGIDGYVGSDGARQCRGYEAEDILLLYKRHVINSRRYMAGTHNSTVLTG
jgi:hypothetical protein